MPPAHDLTALVRDAASEQPDKLAVVESGGRSLTWTQLEDDVRRISTGLGEHGIVAGHRVMIATGNRIEFVTTYLAVLRAQAVAVPVNPGASSFELARMIADSGSRLVVTDESTVGPVREALRLLKEALEGIEEGWDPDVLSRAAQARVVTIGVPAADGELDHDALRSETPREIPPLPDPEKLACLLYTSGTSGRPRGAMLSHRALLANIEQVAAVEPPMMHGDDVVLCVLPLFHVYGLNAVLGGVLRHRAKLVLAEWFDPQGTLDLIEDEACSVVPVAPPVFGYWRAIDGLEERLGPVRLILSGSAPLSTEVIEEFTDRTGIPIHQGYGLTEASPVVTSTLRSKTLQNGSVGAALEGVEIRLVDESGRPVSGEAEDDPGEIQIKGDNLFSGYWPDRDDGPDADGWWATGDIGFLDPSGDLFLVDRLKEMVIVSGFNVYPTEVEDVIRDVPGVQETAVIGVEDAESGEAVVAYVVADGDLANLEEAVRERCRERLARFKQPSRIEIVDELPLTVTGKVQKGRLRSVERRRALGILE
jgi:long-chain acyl-CoA synthetase